MTSPAGDFAGRAASIRTIERIRSIGDTMTTRDKEPRIHELDNYLTTLALERARLPLISGYSCEQSAAWLAPDRDSTVG